MSYDRPVLGTSRAVAFSRNYLVYVMASASNPSAMSASVRKSSLLPKKPRPARATALRRKIATHKLRVCKASAFRRIRGKGNRGTEATPRRVPRGVQVIHYSMPDRNGMSNRVWL
jgi:hypothetical protein